MSISNLIQQVYSLRSLAVNLNLSKSISKTLQEKIKWLTNKEDSEYEFKPKDFMQLYRELGEIAESLVGSKNECWNDDFTPFCSQVERVQLLLLQMSTDL